MAIISIIISNTMYKINQYAILDIYNMEKVIIFYLINSKINI